MRKPPKNPQSTLTRNFSVSTRKGRGNYSGILSEKTPPDTQERLNSEFSDQTNVARYILIPLNTLNEIAPSTRSSPRQGPRPVVRAEKPRRDNQIQRFQKVSEVLITPKVAEEAKYAVSVLSPRKGQVKSTAELIIVLAEWISERNALHSLQT